MIMEKVGISEAQKASYIKPACSLTTSACSGIATNKSIAEPYSEKGAVKTASMGIAPSQSQLYLKRVSSASGAAEFGIHHIICYLVELIIEIGEGQYKVYGGRLITMQEAEATYNRCLEDSNKGYHIKKILKLFRIKRAGWAEEEIQLLQWVVCNYACQNYKIVENFVTPYCYPYH